MLRGLPCVLAAVVIGCLVQPSHQQSTGICPNGLPSLPIDCDPKHPWPRCPPQTYCYATNSVDIGPYFCCPAGGPGSAVPTNTPSPITVSPTTQYPLQSPVPSTQWQIPNQILVQNPYPPQQVARQIGPMETRSFGQFPGTKARKPVDEDAEKISSSISKWLEKQQAGQSK